VAEIEELERARQSYAEGAWEDAHQRLADADRRGPLGAEELELLATCAYMLGREEEYFDVLERAHRGHLEAGAPLRAARCGFWIGVNLAVRGKAGRAGGWLATAERIVEREGSDCVERGYLLIPRVFQEAASGRLADAARTASQAAEAGERFGDRDLFALAIHEQGHLLIRDGALERGLGLLDEAMVALEGGEMSPIVTGIVYCGAILACQDACEIGRAQEWTAALSRWWERQPDLIAFTGRCLVHRAELTQLRGRWREAADEARRAAERSLEGGNPRAAGEAAYLIGEIHRMQGRSSEAENSYRGASGYGRAPQPGLALLRLSQGRKEDALAAARRALSEASELPERIRILPALVEIALEDGQLEEGRRACEELEEIASRQPTAMVEALASGARGAVELAADEAAEALPALRRAWQRWQELDSPYESARIRVMLGRACRAMGDREAAALEVGAAREAFAELGAEPDLARLDELDSGRTPGDLTAREVEVLRLVARGVSNREIAAELVISEHTVARHLQNIFAKLGVSSRTAATAYAFEHGIA
jgi:DNA-binding NarL/FixJ family response regulator